MLEALYRLRLCRTSATNRNSFGRRVGHNSRPRERESFLSVDMGKCRGAPGLEFETWDSTTVSILGVSAASCADRFTVPAVASSLPYDTSVANVRSYQG